MRLFALLLIWFCAFSVPATAQDGAFLKGPQEADNIVVELVPMSAWAAPGSTAVVALKQTIAPGWHTYWRNPGDSGGATTLTWTLPQGVAADAIVWPLPQRQRLLGLVNYGYEGSVLLPVPVRIPAGTKTGTAVPLKVEATLFVCSDEMCVPRTFRLALDLPVRDGAAPLSRDGAAIERIVETAPRPAGIEARLEQTNGALTLAATGGPLAGADPGPVWFFPDRAGQVDHAAAQSGEWGPNGLTLRLKPGPDRAETPDAPLSGVLQTGHGAYEIATTSGGPLTGVSGRVLTIAPEAGAAPNAASPPLWQAALFALVGGLILNLMPCVFPILAMKAAALTASAQEPRTARRDGLLFLAGVLASFLGLAGVLMALRAGGQAVGWGFQLQSPVATASLALLMLAVGLNLSGVFHVGAGVQGIGSGPLARAPGGLAAFLTGVLAVVVAAPCTAPFMAAAVGAALVMSWPAALLVFAMLGLGLAAPYVAVSLSPGVLARMPRPGVWMERLKALLAFPMYGAALWLAWVFSRQTGSEALAPLFGAGLSLALALWLYGAGQTARDAGARAVVHLTAAVAALFLSVGLAVVAVRTPPSGALPASASALPSQPWSSEAVQAALTQDRPVLVDFTADWCVSCKINERTALASPRVALALKTANAAYLVADWTRRDDAIAAELQRHGRSGVPLYLVYRPGQAEPRILPQLLTEGVVVEALEGVGR